MLSESRLELRHQETPSMRSKASKYLLPVLVTCSLLLAHSSAFAACHVIKAGGSGSRNGADWNNSYSDIPSSLTRGDVYYVAAGNYGRHVFNDSASGSTVIEVRAATAGDHCTDTGWNSSTMLGKAVFQAGSANSSDIFQFDAPYYKINGVSRGSGSGNPYADWQTGYNISLSNANGNLCSGSSGEGQNEHIGGTASNITIDYVEIVGNTPSTDSCAALGVYPSGNNWTISHSYLHNVGARMFEFDGNSGITTSYNFLKHNYTSTSLHGECYQIGSNLTNFTAAYNYIVDCVGTAYMATASGGSYNGGNNRNGPWYIYGNVFDADGSNCGVGDGHIYIFDASFTGDLYIFNNLFADLNNASCGTDASGIFFAPAGDHTEIVQNTYIFNNVHFNDDQLALSTKCQSGSPAGSSSGLYCASGATYNWDYQSYYSMADSSDSNDKSSHVQVSSANPFTSSGSHNWMLTTDTSAGFSTNSLLAGNGTDLMGHTRGADGTWDRGALQIPGNSSAPNPPTGLTATVQ